MTIKPATPLPWIAQPSPSFTPLKDGDWQMLRYTTDDDGIHYADADMQYIAHAANAYPKLVEALRKFDKCIRAKAMIDARALLRELGEKE